MPAHGRTDYAFLAKTGFLLGLSMLMIGAGGEFVGTTMSNSLPGWEHALFFDLEVLGILVGLFAPLGFGIVLPLLE